MSSLTVISDRLDALANLRRNEIILLEEIREEFRPDLLCFIVGETLSMRDGKIVIGNRLYKKWINKLITGGFDYEIDFKKFP